MLHSLLLGITMLGLRYDTTVLDDFGLEHLC